LLEERPPGGLAAQCLQLIRAMDAEPACRFGTLEPRQRCCELLHRLADRQRVPRDRVLRTPLETAFCDHTAPTAITHCALRSYVTAYAASLQTRRVPNPATIVSISCIDK